MIKLHLWPNRGRRRIQSPRRRRSLWQSLKGWEPMESRRMLAADPFPYVQSISLVGPTQTDGSSISWNVTFSESVTGVDAGDFALARSGVTPTMPLTVSGSGASYTVTATKVSGSGTLGLDLVDNGTIRDGANNPLTNPNAAASFADAVTFAVGTPDSRPITLVTADFNGDGKPDLATTNLGQQSVGVLLNVTSTGARTPTYAQAVQVATGPLSHVAAGDLNGDGKPDLAVASFGRYWDNATEYSVVRVFINTTAAGATSPSFSSGDRFAVGIDPWRIAIGDLNGDSKPDLYVANRVNSVSVLLNTTPTGGTTAAFSSQASFGADNRPWAIVIADVNQDSRPDLLASDGNSITVRLNATSAGATTPSFRPSTTLLTATGGSAFSVGDFNADGKADLAVNAGGGPLSIQLNQTEAGATTAAFSSPSTFAFYGDSAVEPAITDLNGDAKPDLVTSFSSTLRVLHNKTAVKASQLSFAEQAVINNPAEGGAGVVVGDMNGDGKADLAVANYSMASVSVLLNSSSGGVTGAVATVVDPSPYVQSISLQGTSPTRATSISWTVTFSEDVTGVDANDFALALSGVTASPTLTVSGNKLTYTVTANEVSGTGTIGLNLVDNGTIYDSANNALTKASVAPSFTRAPFDPTTSGARDVAIGDLNGDGKPDVVRTGYSSNSYSSYSGKLNVFLNTMELSATAPSFASPVSFGTGNSPRVVTLSDINRDGRPDIVVGTVHGLDIFINTTPTGAASPSFAERAVWGLPGGIAVSIAIGDLNADGKPDLAVAVGATNGGSSRVGIFLNTTVTGATAPSFSNFGYSNWPIALNQGPEYTFTTAAHPQSIAIADLNADGRPDLAIANQYPDSLSIFFNTIPAGASTPSFTPAFNGQTTFATGFNPGRIVAADFNSDGKPDLAFNSADGLSLYLNQTVLGATIAAFATRQTFGLAVEVVGDLNGDGTLDLAWSSGSEGVAFALNTTPRNATVASFSERNSVWTSQRTYGVAMGDLNGDGKPDLAYANFTSQVALLNRVRADVIGDVATRSSSQTDISLSSAVVAENRPVGTTVGTLSTTAANVGDTFTYTLVTGDGSTNNTLFTIVGNELRTAASFDFETKSSYSIRVRSTDQGGLFTEKQLTITVTDVPENTFGSGIWGWAGAVIPDNTLVTAVASDSAGNVYVAGHFTGNPDFDLGPGTAILTSTMADGFVAKYSSTGSLQWVTQIGGTQEQYPEGIAVDSSGNILVGGYFSGAATFGTGLGTTTSISPNGYDGFVYKLDSLGQSQWVKTFGGGFGCYLGPIATDASGSAIVVGSFSDSTIDFDPGAGTANLTATGRNSVVVKLDAAGNYAWATNFTGGAASDVATDASGNILVTGTYQYTVDFDPGPGIATLTSGAQAAYLVKLSSAGAYQWARSVANSDWSHEPHVTFDSSGSAFIAGQFTGTVDFDPGVAVDSRTAAGSSWDAFVTKFTAAGDYVWTKQISGAGDESVESLATNVAGDVFLAGKFAAAVDVDPGAGVVTLTSAGGTDVMLVQLSAAGDYRSARRYGGAAGDYAVDVAIDGTGSAIVVGQFNDALTATPVEFGPIPGDAALVGGDRPAFILKLANRAPTDIALSAASIAENQPAGTAVATLSTTDPDVGDTFAYTLVAGTGSTDNASFTFVGNELRTTASFDFETKSSYSIRVRSTDQAGLFTEKTFVVKVVNLGESSPDLQQGLLASYQLDGNARDSSANQRHGTATNVTPTQNRFGVENAAMSFNGIDASIAVPHDASFNALPLSVSLWFQTTSTVGGLVGKYMAAGWNGYQVSMGNSGTVWPWYVMGRGRDVIGNYDVNGDNNPAFRSAALNDGAWHSLVFTVDASGGALFVDGVLQATKEWRGDPTVVTNTLPLFIGRYFGERNEFFNGSIDDVRLYDRVLSPVEVGLLNDDRPPTDIVLSATSIAENRPAGTAVATLSTTDPDVGDTFTYTLVAGTGSTNNASFTIVGNELRANASFDFETKSSYTIRVRSTDQGGLFFEKFFTITVTDVPDVTFGSGAWGWAGAVIPDNTLVKAVTADSAGSVYVAGHFTGNPDFDLGPGTAILTSTMADGFVAKYSATGALQWVAQIGGTQEQYPEGIAVDSSGNILVGGYFSGAATFGTGLGTTTSISPNGYDGFVFKLNSLGQSQWVRTFGGGFGCSLGPIATDASGAAIVVGSFSDSTIDFDPGVGTANRTATGRNSVVVKLDAAGNYAWATNFTGGAASDVATDASGNVLMTGVYQGTVDFDPGPGTATLTSNASQAAYLVKLSSAGAYQWARSVANSDWAHLPHVTVDGSGSAFIAGQFTGTVDFNPGVAVDFRTAAGSSWDAFVTKFTAAGGYVWTRQISGAGDESVESLATNVAGDVFLAGKFAATVDADPGAGVVTLTSAGGTDVMLVQLSAAGDYRSARRYGGAAGDYAVDVAVDGTGSAIVVGQFNDALTATPVEFGPIPGDAALVGGDRPAFILKLANRAPTNIALSATSIAENNAPSAVIGTLSTTDPDAGNTFTYALVSGEGSSDNSSFTILGNQLRANASFDFEAKSSHSIRVRSTDQGGLFTEKVFLVAVTDVLEPTISIAAASADKAEGTGAASTSFSFIVTRSGNVTATATVSWAVAGSGANPATAADFPGGRLPSGTVSFAPRETTKTITVNVLADSTVETDEGFVVTLSAPTRATLGSAVAASGVIRNDDLPVVVMGDAAIAEGDAGTKAVAVTVSLSAAAFAPVTVAYTTFDRTARISGLDYVAASGTLTFAPGEISKTIPLSVRGDANAESDESFGVRITTATGARVGRAEGTVTIVNDDVPLVSVAATDAVKREGNTGRTAFTFTVTRQGGVDDDLLLPWSLSGDGERPADRFDFIAGVLPTGTVLFGRGMRTATILVNVFADRVAELDEQFRVTVGDALSSVSATGTIVNDDAGTPRSAASVPSQGRAVEPRSSGATAPSQSIIAQAFAAMADVPATSPASTKRAGLTVV